LEGGSSVAKKVAEELGLRHAYCDPDLGGRASLGVGIHQEDREPIWVKCCAMVIGSIYMCWLDLA